MAAVPQRMYADVMADSVAPAADSARSSAPAATDRITVALIEKAAGGLALLQDRTGLSKTDIVNRAITAYEFLEEQLRDGRDLIVRDRETGETQLVRFL
jgi:hypothetical protein